MLSPFTQTLPLAENQVGLWHLQTIHPDLHAYNTSSVFRVRSAFDPVRAEQALSRLVAQEPLLRTTFVLHGGTPQRLVHGWLAPAFAHHQVTVPDEAIFQQRVQAAHACPFDLSTGPLVRLTLFTRTDNEHVVLLTFHHILLDFASQTSLTQQFFDLYVAGADAPVDDGESATGTGYDEFVHWQQEYLASPAAEKAAAYWQGQLPAPLPVLDLPTTYPLPRQQTFHGDMVRVTLPTALSQSLIALARRQRITPFALLMTAYAVLLARYSNQDELIVGIPTDERLRAPQHFQQTVGHLINLLPMRVDLAAQPSFSELAKAVQQTVLGGLFHQNYPFARIVQAAAWAHDAARSPLFDVAFNMPVLEEAADFVTLMEGTPSAPTTYRGLDLEPFTLCQQAGQTFLNLDLWLADTEFVGFWKYNSDLFDEAAIERMGKHFQVLLEGIIKQPDAPVHTLPLLTEAEYQQIVYEWNDTAIDFGEPQTIHALFEQQVAQTPDAIALVFDKMTRWQGDKVNGVEDVTPSPLHPLTLTYAELNACANQLAHHLIELGIQADTLVAVAMERSLEMVVSLLAVLKAGGAYVPIDPTYPAERIRYMLTDSAAPILLTQSYLPLVQGMDQGTAQVIAVDQTATRLATYPTTNPQPQTTPADLAYVIYTSGSTGNAKGTLIPHQNVWRLLAATDGWFGFNAGDVWTLFHSFAFDFSVWELWGALCYGGRLVVVPYAVSRDPQAFYQLVCDQGVTVLNQTPSAFRQLMTVATESSQVHTLRYVIFGGEALEFESLRPWFARYGDSTPQLVNMYGITETTVHVTYQPIQAADLDERRGSSRIGQAIPDLQLYILDAHRAPVPVGVVGELYVGGAGLARGYLNRQELTAERFINHPVFGRLYKTGDLCRWLPGPEGGGLSGANIEYIGRMDFQVKIRGFRIELGEIESALLAQEGVCEAVVLAREDNPGDKRLVAYMVMESQRRKVATSESHDTQTTRPNDQTTLRYTLAQRLPDYMIPAAFVFLDALPLTPNGKLDRKALPAPEYTDTQSKFVAPRSETEIVLAQAFADVLRVDRASPEQRRRVGIHDNFFRMGGDSILSIQVVSRVAQQGYRVSVKDIFQYPTIAELAANLERTSEAVQVMASQEAQQGEAPLLPIQRWLLDANQPELHHFNQSFLLTVKQPINPSDLQRALRTLLQHHDALRFQYRYDQESTKWQQRYLATYMGDDEGRLPFRLVDLQAVVPADRSATIERMGTETQADLDPLAGDLVRFVYFQMNDAGEQTDRLLIVIHHLAVDGVSWRILLEDLTTLLDGGQLPPKSSSYRDWGETLQRATAAGHFDNDINHWLADDQVGHLAPLPLDHPAAVNTVGNSHQLSLALTQEQTAQLLRTLPEQHDVTLDAVLLTALTETLTGESGERGLRVKFESYGRQELFRTINLNRTIGWFTSAYPVTIPRFAGSAVKRIRYTLNQLRRVPEGGISFGALQDCHPDATVRSKMAALPPAQVVYNYLGQLDSLDNQRFGLASESAGPAVSSSMARDTLLDSNAMIVNGQLHVHWTVSPQIDLERAEALLEEFQQQLHRLMQEALASQEQVAIPTDLAFADAELTLEQLESLLNPSVAHQAQSAAINGTSTADDEEF